MPLNVGIYLVFAERLVCVFKKNVFTRGDDVFVKILWRFGARRTNR